MTNREELVILISIILPPTVLYLCCVAIPLPCCRRADTSFHVVRVQPRCHCIIGGERAEDQLEGSRGEVTATVLKRRQGNFLLVAPLTPLIPPPPVQNFVNVHMVRNYQDQRHLFLGKSDQLMNPGTPWWFNQYKCF